VCGAPLLEDAINLERYVSDILLPFLRALPKKKRHEYFMQYGATAHTSTYLFSVLNEVFEDRLISRRL
jgi:hypothetical protein